MTNLFLGFLNRSLSAAVLIFAVVLVRLVFKKAPKWLLCALWALAAVRLLCPFSIESVLSLIPSAEPVQPEIVYSAAPAITSGIPAVDAIVNPPLQAAFTPDPAQSANPLQILTELAAWVWLGGCAVLILYAAISALRLRLRVRTAVRLEGNVFQSEFVPSPFILGVLRPRIYLPFGLEPGAQDMVLAHERAHLKRGDQLWKPLGFLLLTAYWFNPVCWLAYVLFCRDIEAACDEKVVRELGDGCKAAYSRALLQCSVPRRMITACPLAFGETGVKGRIKSVLHYKKPAFWVVLAAVAVSIAVAVCFLTDPKQDAEQPEEETPASATVDGPAEVDSTPPTSWFFSSIEEYAEYYIEQVILQEPIEYKVQTDGGFETVTDTVLDAQLVNLEQLASLPGLDPEGELQLWSYKIAIAPENADGRTFMLGTDTGLSYIDGQEYLVDNTRYLVTVTYRSETQDYRILGWTKDTDGTALAVYEQTGSLKDYLYDTYVSANGGQPYYRMGFYNGMDGYGQPLHLNAYFMIFRETDGARWGAYLPTADWLQNLGSQQWYSAHHTGSTLEVAYDAGVSVSERSAAYAAQGYDGQTMSRCTVYTLESGEQNTLVYLYGAKDGCFAVTIHWPHGEDQTDVSGYNPYLQARCEGQILKQIAASFTPLDEDGTALDTTLLAQVGAYRLLVRYDAVPCPEERPGCSQHWETSLVSRSAETGAETVVDGPRENAVYWFLKSEYEDTAAFLGISEQDSHTGLLSAGNMEVFFLRGTADVNFLLADVFLSGPNEPPAAVETDETVPVQPCELTLPNGVYLGMDYETAVKTAQSYRNGRVWRGRMPGDNFTVDGVSYYFTPDSDRVLRLDSVAIPPTADSGTFSPDFLRGTAIGSSLQSILDTIPVDPQMQLLTLPQDYYRTQDLYGSNAAASYAFLGAGTDYRIRFYTGNFSASLRFDDSNAVIEISLSVRH